MNHEKYIQRCLDLAIQGLGNVAPNPLVGCVIVHQNRIIGEGFHIRYGGAHAEVNAINSVRDRFLLKESTLYVSLEPCAHYGKTPPCTDLILKEKIGHVVVGAVDSCGKVDGRGIEKLKNSGVKVETAILEKECRWQNRRFFTFHEKKRPYIILKWAQSSDDFMGARRNESQYGQPEWISNALSRQMVHKSRTCEAAILVGGRTALTDNPSLTARDWSGNQPLRIVIDKRGDLPIGLRIFDRITPTLVFTPLKPENLPNLEFIQIDFKSEFIEQQILHHLFVRDIQSVIIEGGGATLNGFIRENLWDEAHIYRGNRFLLDGIEAPKIKGKIIAQENFDDDLLTVLVNENAAFAL